MTRSFISKTVAGCFLLVSSGWAFTQSLAPKDPGVRGGLANTGGGLQQGGIRIAKAPVIRPNPKTGVPVSDNERASFEEGILRAGQLESTCDTCADVTEGSPVAGELDPVFPQTRTNSNGLGARH